MTNVVFDLSNMFFRSLFIVGGYGAKNYSFDSQKEVDELMRKVSIDISYIIRQTNPSRIIFTLDSRSWRKQISIDENEGYKANREKSGTINWDNVFATMKEFGEILDSVGFIVSQVENAEADDLMALWTGELLYNENQHVILVSSDEDIRQLIRFWPYEPNKMVFSTVYNPFAKKMKKLFIPTHFNEWLNNDAGGDIFNRAIDVDKEDFMRLRDSEKIELEYVNGEEIALKKIFCGDDGDNIPSIYSWINDKGKTVRITNTKYKKIIENVDGILDYLDLTSEKLPAIFEQLKSFSGETPNFDMADRLLRQIKLVVLSREIFPDDITLTFDNELADHLKKPNINPQEWNMNSILEGTRYTNAKSQSHANEASIFKEVDRLNKELF